jgi:hypothetical protein
VFGSGRDAHGHQERLTTHTLGASLRLEDLIQAMKPVTPSTVSASHSGLNDCPLPNHVRIVCHIMHRDGHVETLGQIFRSMGQGPEAGSLDERDLRPRVQLIPTASDISSE